MRELEETVLKMQRVLEDAGILEVAVIWGKGVYDLKKHYLSGDPLPTQWVSHLVGDVGESDGFTYQGCGSEKQVTELEDIDWIMLSQKYHKWIQQVADGGTAVAMAWHIDGEGTSPTNGKYVSEKATADTIPHEQEMILRELKPYIELLHGLSQVMKLSAKLDIAKRVQHWHGGGGDDIDECIMRVYIKRIKQYNDAGKQLDALKFEIPSELALGYNEAKNQATDTIQIQREAKEEERGDAQETCQFLGLYYPHSPGWNKSQHHAKRPMTVDMDGEAPLLVPAACPSLLLVLPDLARASPPFFVLLAAHRWYHHHFSCRRPYVLLLLLPPHHRHRPPLTASRPLLIRDRGRPLLLAQGLHARHARLDQPIQGPRGGQGQQRLGHGGHRDGKPAGGRWDRREPHVTRRRRGLES